MRNHVHIGTLMIVAGLFLGADDEFAIRFIWELTLDELVFRFSILGLLSVGVLLLWNTPEE